LRRGAVVNGSNFRQTSWVDVMITIFCDFLLNVLSFMQKEDHYIGFQEKRQRKLAKIFQSSDPNTDP
jgi:hypothetical protein